MRFLRAARNERVAHSVHSGGRSKFAAAARAVAPPAARGILGEWNLGIGGSFRYLHQLEDPDDRVAILEFATEVGGKQVEGIDKLTFDEDGLITELKVMIRPASALQLVGARMAEEFPRVGLGLPS